MASLNIALPDFGNADTLDPALRRKLQDYLANLTDELRYTLGNLSLDDLGDLTGAISGKYLQTGSIGDDKLYSRYLLADTAHMTFATIEKLTADYLNAQQIDAKYADIETLEADDGYLKNLRADVANIGTLLAGNVGADNLAAGAIQAGSAVIAEGAIASAQIISLDVSKLLAGNISTNKFTVESDSGNFGISENTLHVWDANKKERVSLGLNGSDYNLTVRAADGQTTIFGADGVTNAGITAGAVDDSKVAVNANINAGKIDQESLVTRINGASTLLKASHVNYDPTGQTLDIAFEEMSQNITYKVDIISTNGNIYKGGDFVTTLMARVYQGTTDLTDTIDANRFRWTRVSDDTAGDTAWNTSHFGGAKQVTVTQSDVMSRATFQCTILDENLN